MHKKQMVKCTELQPLTKLLPPIVFLCICFLISFVERWSNSPLGLYKTLWLIRGVNLANTCLATAVVWLRKHFSLPFPELPTSFPCLRRFVSCNAHRAVRCQTEPVHCSCRAMCILGQDIILEGIMGSPTVQYKFDLLCCLLPFKKPHEH